MTIISISTGSERDYFAYTANARVQDLKDITIIVYSFIPAL